MVVTWIRTMVLMVEFHGVFYVQKAKSQDLPCSEGS